MEYLCNIFGLSSTVRRFFPMTRFTGLFAMLLIFAGLSMAQNCTLQTCHITQVSPVRVVAENGIHVCFVTQAQPESITITCQSSNVTKFTTQINFSAGECIGGNFLGGIIQWSLCRTGNDVSLFSWDVTAGPLEKTGTLF